MKVATACQPATVFLDCMQTPAGAERRIHPRHDVEGVTGTLSYAVGARVRNISLSGIALETNTSLRVGKSYAMMLGGEEEGIEVSVLVRRSTLRRTVKAPNGDVVPVYETGLSFDRISSEVRAALRTLIARTVVLKPEPSLPGFLQFPAAAGEVATEGYPCEVLRISRSGLLVDTGLPGAEGELRWVTVCLPVLSFCSQGEIVNLGPRPEDRGLRLQIEFRETPPADLQRLETFLQQELDRAESASEADPIPVDSAAAAGAPLEESSDSEEIPVYELQ